MREKCLIISKLCVGLTFYITLCCVVACLFLRENSKKKETSWYVHSLVYFFVGNADRDRQTGIDK